MILDRFSWLSDAFRTARSEDFMNGVCTNIMQLTQKGRSLDMESEVSRECFEAPWWCGVVTMTCGSKCRERRCGP